MNTSVYPAPTDTLVSYEQRLLADNILLIIRYIAVVLSLPLTICNIAVFLHKDMRSSTGVYIIAISISQIVFVVGSSLRNIFYETFEDPLNDEGYWAFNLYGAVFCGIVAKRGSYVVMCLVSMERLYAIARPLHVKTFLLHRRPFLSVAATYSFAGLLHVYILAKTEIRLVAKTPKGRPIYKPAPTSLYLQHKSVNDSFSLTTKILLSYCALSLLIGLNVATVLVLKRYNMAATHVSSSAKEEQKRRQERQMTLTILVATIFYVALSLPVVVHNLIYTLIPEYYGLYGKYDNVYAVMSNVTLVLSLLSCCVDFVCFILLSSRYRQTVFKVCGEKMFQKSTNESVVPSHLSEVQQT
ncbi:hypothetical protein ACOMHN_035335 [Nucella lapillus]